jgi:serine phosphatase RsbU (regulator of sigma subunit)/CHASE3 domain sensor protein
MSLRARLTLLCAVFLALAVGVSALGAILVLRANDQRRHHADLVKASEAAQDLESTYVAEAASIRAYFLAGEQQSLDDYNRQRTHSGDVNGWLQGLLLGTALIHRVDAVNAAARVWRNDAILPLITLQQSTGQSNEVIAQYRDGPAVPAFQTIAKRLQRLRADVEAAGTRSGHRADVARERVLEFSFAALAATLATLLLLRLITHVWVARPIQRLARSVKDGDVEPRVPRRGASEIASLSRAIRGANERLHQELDAAVRTREGLSQTAEVLMSIRAELAVTPQTLPAGWSAAAQLVPASGIVAGDCYNIDSIDGNSASIVVVDVAGHGAGSAVVALRAKELLRAAARSYENPSDAVTWASAQLSDLESDMFITAFVARVDFTTGLVRFVNAGHPDALICDGANVIELAPTGPLIGPFSGRWDQREAVIGPGQMLVCYTDGVIEVRNDEREEFGLDRLRAALQANYGDATGSIVKNCLAEVDAFGSGRAHDDVTIAIVARALPM